MARRLRTRTPTGRRAAALLVLAVLLGVGAARVLVHPSGRPAPARVRLGAGFGGSADPLRYTTARRAEFERRAAAGLAHPLFAFSPGGAVATAARVARWRPAIERVASKGGADADTLEGIVFLESAGRADAQAGGVRDATGLTQILAETATGLLGLSVDLARSARLTRGIALGHRVAQRRRERRRVDERFDPEKALAATVRYLAFARDHLHGRDDLAVESYHMGVGNLQDVLARFGAAPSTSYAELFFTASPLDRPRAAAKLASFGDASSTYLWRVRAAMETMRRWRADPAALATTATLQTHKNSAEEVLHPAASTPRYADADALRAARDAGTILPLDAAQLRAHGLRIDPSMGELAKPRTEYRGLRRGALRVLAYLGDGVHAISGSSRPLTVTSTVRDEGYQALLIRRNIEATRAYSLHTTGWAFDVARRYANRKQALAFQFLLDRLTALDLIAWVREPGAIHVTVAGDADRLLGG